LLCFYVLGWFLRGIFYRHHQRADSLEGTVRMCSITDNMTAVAITFLITTITSILLSNKGQSFSTVLYAVLTELPVYGFSLLIVGFFWLSHHRIFMFFAFRALLVPIIFILSIAIIIFRNNLVIYFWLLVIVLEVVDLVYRRV
jgi:uncharacterized membrane protein